MANLYFSVVGIAALLLLATFVGAAPQDSIRRTIREAVDEHGHGPAEVEHFAEIGNYLLDEELAAARVSQDFESDHERAITANQVELLVSTLFSRVGCEERVANCSKCADDFVNDLFAALNVSEAQGLDVDAFFEAGPLLLYAVTQVEEVCAAGPGGTSLEEDAVFGYLRSAGVDGANLTLAEEDLDEILHLIGENYTALTQATCFDVESVFVESVADHEAGANDTETHAVAESVIAALLQGHCIGEPTLPTTEAFIDGVFTAYAEGATIHEEDFFVMLQTLGIGGSGAIVADPHNHRRRRRDTVAVVAAVGSVQRAHSREKRVVDSHGHAHGAAASGGLNVSETCFTGEQLLDIHGVDHELGITEAQYVAMAPSLVQQIISGVCSLTNTTVSSQITTAEVWGYGTLAVLLISMLAVVGALFIPCMSGFTYEAVIQTMIALAVATLTGDAVLHLIPQAVGLHAHDAAAAVDVHTAHGPNNPELAYVWKCLVVEMAIYGFFLFESLMGLLSCCKHSHSHTERPVEMDEKSMERRNSARAYKKTKNGSLSKRDLTNEEEETTGYKRNFFSGCGTVSFMILMGDSLHNFGDGLAIGAAFSSGLGPGISTSVAVLCHELPHELGDLAVLLNQGMRFSTAIFLNFLSACTAFIGLWIGIPISQNESVREWIFAATAGMFLYVGLVSMLPELQKYNGKNKGCIFLLQNIGFLIGAAIILVIALYEDAITITV